MCDFGEGGEQQPSLGWQKHFGRRLPWSQESDVSVHDFSAFLDRRRCKKRSSSVLLLINLSLKACSASFFPRAQTASFLTSFQRVLKVSDCGGS